MFVVVLDDSSEISSNNRPQNRQHCFEDLLDYVIKEVFINRYRKYPWLSYIPDSLTPVNAVVIIDQTRQSISWYLEYIRHISYISIKISKNLNSYFQGVGENISREQGCEVSCWWIRNIHPCFGAWAGPFWKGTRYSIQEVFSLGWRPQSEGC